MKFSEKVEAKMLDISSKLSFQRHLLAIRNTVYFIAPHYVLVVFQQLFQLRQLQKTQQDL